MAPDKPWPTIEKRFIVNRQGKDFVLYAGLLDAAHQDGLCGINTNLVQAPRDDNGNLAICHAVVVTERGTFHGIGDASAENVGRMIAPHIVRMAETRAKARALRDAVNVGMTALEELADDDTPHRAATRPVPAPSRAIDQTEVTDQQLVAIRQMRAKLGMEPSFSKPDGYAAASSIIRQLQSELNRRARGG